MPLRDHALEKVYQEYKKTAPAGDLHNNPSVLEWEYWRLVNNKFPYTKITTAHAMVVLKRDCSIYNISAEELTELWVTILPWADKIYDTSMINLAAFRSINGTPHLHLVTYRPEFK